jgi:hypothetical protein
MGIVLLIKAAAHNSKIKYKGKKKQSAKTKENVGFAISRKRIVGHVGCAEQRNGKLMYQQQALRPNKVLFVVWFAFLPPSRPPCENPAERSQKQETPGDFHRAECNVGHSWFRCGSDSNAKVCWWQKKRKGCSKVRERRHADPRRKSRHVLVCRPS